MTIVRVVVIAFAVALVPISPARAVIEVGMHAPASGNTHSCSLSTDGELYCWGTNAYGELGLGAVGTQTTPVALSTGGLTFTSLFLGHDHSCAIASPGSLYCWGHNDRGQLGLGNFVDKNLVTQVGVATNWAQGDAGYGATCAINQVGELFCWGHNIYGQLGLGNNTDTTTPQQVGSAANWETVRVGDAHTCAINTIGELYCWGRNNMGQLGLGNNINFNTPQQVGADTNWVTMDIGYDHTCAVKSTGSLYCWGNNADGQLGNGSFINENEPVQVGASSSWTAVTLGSYYSCALFGEGGLYCWGFNDYGNLGIGVTGDQENPVQVATESHRVIAVNAGDDTTCAVTDGRRLYCWGWNGNSEVGDGTSVNRLQPVLIFVQPDLPSTNRAPSGVPVALLVLATLGTAVAVRRRAQEKLGK